VAGPVQDACAGPALGLAGNNDRGMDNLMGFGGVSQTA